MKKWISIALCAALALSMTACSSSDTEEEETPEEPETVQTTENEDTSAEEITGNEDVELANPVVEYETLEEAQDAAGFVISTPETIGDSTECIYQVIDGETLEVIYQTEGQETAVVRKAPGSADISGDSQEYAQTRTTDVGVSKVTMKGQDDLVSLAIWNDDTYTYSVSVQDGMTEEDMTQLVLTLQEGKTV